MSKAMKVVKTIADEVAAIVAGMATVSVDKSARILGKSYSKDAKLNKFLEADFSTGLKLFTDETFREKMLERVAVHGITSIEQKQALALKVLTADAKVEAEKKRKEITNGLVLNDEQKAKLASKLLQYSDFIINTLKPGVMEVAKELGAVEPVEETEAVEAEA